MGLEQGAGSCFALQIGRCRGTCIGREPRALHDARVRLALASLRLKPWPFPGAIGIREHGAAGAVSVLHVIDRWRHLGTATDEDGICALLDRAGDAGFDPDAYRIIARCLERVAPRDIVMLGGQRR
jgi:DNA polymerase-3 subunit epsilon